MKLFWTCWLVFCCSIAANATSLQTQNDLGGMTPVQALEYMKETEDLVIIDVATRRWFAKNHFINAVNIPIEDISSAEAEELYLKIPAGHPVLLHCRLGMIAPSAYRTLQRLRTDIPWISYIAGVPPFEVSNNWHTEQMGRQVQ